MPSPARSVAVAVRPGEHACCRFAAAGDRRRVAVDIVREGLQRGDRVLYVCDRDDVQEFVSELAALDDEVIPAIERGQLHLCASADFYVPDGRFDIERTLASWREAHDRARSDGYAGLTVTGEVGEAFCAAGGTAAVEAYEQRLDELGLPNTVLLCQYDHARFDAATLKGVARSHDVDLAPELAAIGRDGVLTAARLRSGGLRLAGELDFESAPTFAGVLGAHFHGPLELDLADLRYVDVSGMRALRGRTGQQLTIAGASESVRKLLALVGWDTDPALEIPEPR
jgi:anti-anti-sigma regulatory factor